MFRRCRLPDYDAKTLAKLVGDPYAGKKHYQSDAFIQAALDVFFPNADQASIRELLETPENEAPVDTARLKCAVILLSNGDPAMIQQYLDAALSDFRDVIYPCQLEYLS
jgi:hypothetical protein